MSELPKLNSETGFSWRKPLLVKRANGLRAPYSESLRSQRNQQEESSECTHRSALKPAHHSGRTHQILESRRFKPRVCSCCGAVTSWAETEDGKSAISGQDQTGLIEPNATNNVIVAKSSEMVLQKPVATLIGKGMYALDWPRLKFPDNGQLRLDWGLDFGCDYRNPDYSILAIDEDTVARVFPKNGDCSWINTFSKRCHEDGLSRAPAASLADRLVIIDLILRTPPYGLAV